MARLQIARLQRETFMGISLSLFFPLLTGLGKPFKRGEGEKNEMSLARRLSFFNSVFSLSLSLISLSYFSLFRLGCCSRNTPS